jgi:PAP2 superfamily
VLSNVPRLGDLDAHVRRWARLATGLSRDWGQQVRRAANTLGSGRRELVIMLAAYGAYSLVKGLAGGSLAVGTVNADRLVYFEQRLGIYIEPGMQRFFVDHGVAMPFWNALYVASQVIVLPLTFILVFLFARRAYPFMRNMFFIAWTAGLVWYALQPVAPPRLAGIGFTDTVSRHTFFDLDSELVRAFYNPVAAMPSLHVGVAPIVGWALWRLTPWVWSRAIGIAYPVLVTVAVIVTGNHFVLDVAGGLLVVLPAAVIARLLTGAPLSLPAPTLSRRRAGGPRTSG